MYAHGFRDSFTCPPGILFTFPSRYLFTIGHLVVFSLARWASRIPTGLHVSRSTWVSCQGRRPGFRLRGSYPLWRYFPAASTNRPLALLPSGHARPDGKIPQHPDHNGCALDMIEVWAVPRSLAATRGIDISFFSWGYLDVSVHPVPFLWPMNSFRNPFSHGSRDMTLVGLPHSDTHGSKPASSSP